MSNPDTQSADVPPSLAEATLDLAVRKLFNLSWEKARNAVSTGKVFVDGKRRTDPREPCMGGQIELRWSAARPLKQDTLARDWVVYYDSDVIVIDKPAGLMAVPFREHGDEPPQKGKRNPTAYDEVRRYLGAQRARNKTTGRATGPLPRLFTVHRLDKETSGLMCFARNGTTARVLSAQFAEHSTERVYRALVYGRPKEETITSHILEDRGDGIRGSWEKLPPHRKSVTPETGELAVTHIKPIKHLGKYSLVECKLETGRTHQIRIHLSEAGHPIIGETVYIRNFGGELIECPRLCLHAAVLGFFHPGTKSQLRFDSEPKFPV